MAYKIILDTTDRYEKSVILKRDKETLGEKHGDIDIVSSIRDLLEEHDLNVTDIDEVEPNVGPGSFTGLKIGVTIANVINWLNGKKELDELDVPDYGREPNITLKEF